jgi:single-strand DNA-binding protein
MFNKVILIGNLTKDPELRYTPQGTPVCTFRLASTQKYKSGEGMKEDTLFINVVVWGKQGETVAQYLSKGKSVLVDGRLQEHRWEADGQQKSRFEVVAQTVRFLGRRDEAGSGEAASDSFSQPYETTDIEPF